MRNAIAHSRELVTFEREIMSGVSTQIRNQVAEHRTVSEPANAHYPLIESALDGFGQPPYVPRYGTNDPPFRRLEVGERLTIRARAIDPRGRPLYWRCQTIAQAGGYFHDRVPLLMENEAEGSPVEIEYTITDSDVGESFAFKIWLIHGGARPFHRNANFDDSRTFYYAVNPPLD